MSPAAKRRCQGAAPTVGGPYRRALMPRRVKARPCRDPGARVARARHRAVPRTVKGMEFGVGYFATHDAMEPGRPRAPGGGGGAGVALLRRAHAHPGGSYDAVPGRGRAAPQVLAHPRPVRDPHRRGRGDLAACGSAAASASSIERDPIITAKEVASVDVLSGGRLEFGVGAGWNREEMENHGTDPRRRMAVLRERVEAMKADLDPGRGDLPRRARQLRPDLVVAEARPAPAPARARRGVGADGARAGARLRRRVVPEPRPGRPRAGRASCAPAPTATSTSW